MTVDQIVLRIVLKDKMRLPIRRRRTDKSPVGTLAVNYVSIADNVRLASKRYEIAGGGLRD